jgi:hypothetical protein
LGGEDGLEPRKEGAVDARAVVDADAARGGNYGLNVPGPGSLIRRELDEAVPEPRNEGLAIRVMRDFSRRRILHYPATPVGERRLRGDRPYTKKEPFERLPIEEALLLFTNEFNI